MLIGELSTRTLGIVSVLTYAVFFLLLTLPYYIIGKEQYIPKNNAIFGYFMPASSEAWILLVFSWVFFALSMVFLFFCIRRKQDEGSKWVTPKRPQA